MIRYDHYTDKFVKVSDRECPWCKAVCASTDKYCHECGWHIADTTQTDCETCKYGEDKHRYAHICNECGVGINNYTPQTYDKDINVLNKPQNERSK